MKSIKILDCTLRDGGYCNKWQFGKDNIRKIISGLSDANIDIIECGFISNKTSDDSDQTKYTTFEKITSFLPKSNTRSMFVAMINYGEFDVDSIPERKEGMINGIRVAFHKKDVDSALVLCSKIKEKGYKLFIQAMVSVNYTDQEYLDLIHRVNKIEPFAFYIVDSFGSMKKNDLMRYFLLVDNNLKKNITVGFHSHNNLQLAYSNTLSLLELRNGRDLIIDSTISGMGRGAGNLSTELFIDHMNHEQNANYDLKPILTIMDEITNNFYQQNPWGYSLPNYLSATHNAHPNYASFLNDKHTLTIDMMDDIFSRLDDDKKNEYDKEYIEKIYYDYLSAGKAHESNYRLFANKIKGKTILLIAPGKSSYSKKDEIIKYANSPGVISISVNHDYPYFDTDYVFVSNALRFSDIPKKSYDKCIITSNIPCDETFLQVKYRDLLIDNELIRDNAGLMASNMLFKCDVKSIMLAGFDGYSYDPSDNYAEGQKAFITKKATIDALNEGMTSYIKELSKTMPIGYLTTPAHLK